MSSSRRLLASIHDVAPVHAARLDRLAAFETARGNYWLHQVEVPYFENKPLGAAWRRASPRAERRSRLA